MPAAVVPDRQSSASRQLLVRNPRTGRADYQIDVESRASIERVATRLRASQAGWSALGIEGRSAVMRRWADLITAQREAIINALVLDTGRRAISIGEVDSVARNIRRWCDQSADLLASREFPSRLLPSVSIRDQHVPYELVGCISPWNFPVVLGLIDVVPALLAGCAVIAKPSEITPRCLEPLAATVREVPALAAVFHLALGDAETGRAVVDQVDAVCFTGSVPTGRKVAMAAAERFIPAFLELGGKDPAIVLASADLEIATDAVLRGSIANTGHACMSLERVYVQRAIFEPFVRRLVEKASAVALAWPDISSGYLGPIIFEHQARIIEEQLADALQRGARALTGGQIEDLGGGLYCRPTVLVDVHHGMRIMREETFGPVIPVMPFDTLDEAIALANDSEFGLSACIMSGTVEEAVPIAHRLNVGAISINDACMTYMTYEGEKNSFKYSGLGGSRMGPQGFLRFFRKKALIIQRGVATGVPRS